MSFYRCVSYGSTALQPGYRPIRAESGPEARRAALEILRDNPQIDRVEVWLGGDLAFRLNRHQAKIEGASLRGEF